MVPDTDVGRDVWRAAALRILGAAPYFLHTPLSGTPLPAPPLRAYCRETSADYNAPDLVRSLAA
jgi:hypothetical protein